MFKNFLVNGLDDKLLEFINNLQNFAKGEGQLQIPIAKRVILVLLGLMLAQLVQIYLKRNKRACEKINSYKIPELIILGSILVTLRKLL